MRTQYLSLPILVGFMVVAVDSLRNLPSLALFGEYLPIFFVLGLIFFLLPVLFISAELSSAFAKDDYNGVYHWAVKAFGKNVGMFTIWAQWSNSAIWFPANLIFIVSTFVTIFMPHFQHNQLVLSLGMVALFWVISLINFRGVQESAKIAFACMLFGVLLPITLLITLSILWYCFGYKIQFAMSMNSFKFAFNTDSLSAITAIIASFLGLELCAIHIKHIKRPRQTYTKAIWIAAIIIILSSFIGALSIAILIPHAKISMYDGIANVFSILLSTFHLSFFTPIITIMIVLGSIGSLINWSLSPVKGMSQAAKRGYMPKALAKENKHGAPANIIVLQAIIVTAMCLLLTLFKNISDFYWIFLSLSTEIYLLMYIVIFAAAVKHRIALGYKPTIIKHNSTFYLLIILGISGCVVAFIVGFIPSINVINGMSSVNFLIIFTTSTIGICLFFFIFWGYNKLHTRKVYSNLNRKEYVG